MIGRVVGNYRIDALLGKGGMGAVYRAHDTLLDRTVALKALRADAATDPRSVERFRMEARTLARLLHPNIATLHTLVREPAATEAEHDAYYMVMEYCEGETIESILERRGRLDPAEALPLFTQALDGLEHAHRHGIVHRDIKPANLMRLPDGTVKVMDFGIARLLGSSRMTQTHHTIGTAAYMAPEQIRSQDVDARADVYALGVLLYELLTGRVPFKSESFFEVMQAHLQTPPPPPRQFAPDLPEDLEAVILRALAKKPGDRFSSVVALRAALDALDLPAASRDDDATLPPGLTQPLKLPASLSGAMTVPSEPPEAERNEAEQNTGEPEVDAQAATVALPARPSARAPSRSPKPAATKQMRFSPRAVVVLMGLLLAGAVGAWMLASADEPRRIADTSDTTQAGEAAALLSSDMPEPPGPDADTSPARLASWVATGQALLDDGHLTAPADSNALLFAERTLAAASDHADARALIRDIVQRELELGRQAQRRDDLRTARPHYQRIVAITDRHPEVAPNARASAQSGLSALSAAASLAAQDPPREAPAETQEASTPEPEPEPVAPGTVRVLVRPYGDVYVNGQRRATDTNAPVFADLPPGTHRIRATHPSFGTQERSVRVQSGQTAEVFIEFDAPVRVTVVSEPPNAEIWLDGRATNRYTPATITIPPGRHTVELRRDGYRPASRTVTVETGAAPDRLTFALTPEN